MQAEVSLGITPVVVGNDQIRFQPYCLVVGIYRCFRITSFTLTTEKTDGKPRPGPSLLVHSIHDIGNGTPLFKGFFSISLPLEQGGCGDRFVNEGCRWVFLDALSGPTDLVRVVTDGFGRQLFHKGRGLIALRLDLADEVPGFFGIFSGRRYVFARFCLDLAESLEADIAGDGGDDAEQHQEDGGSAEPPIDGFCLVVQQFAPKFVKTSRNFDVDGSVQARCVRCD